MRAGAIRGCIDFARNDAHIAGIIVHASSEKIDAIRRAICLLPGARIHAVSAAGKLVLTLQTDSSVDLIEQFQAIHDLPGVYCAAIVFENASLAEAPQTHEAKRRVQGG